MKCSKVIALSRQSLRNLFGVTLTLALLLAVFAAIAVALYLSKKLVSPLLALASGTQAVSVGDYRARPEPPSNDEVGQLTRSFNTMTRQLDEARRTLLHSRPPAVGLEPKPRPTWREVLTRPAHPILLGLGAVVVVALAVVPSFAPPPLVLAAAPAFVAATAWAVVASRALLAPRGRHGPSADHGHRITALALLWLPIASAQVVVAIIAGASLLPVLPLSALPLAAAVSAVNPGAGLWRPVSNERPPSA